MNCPAVAPYSKPETTLPRPVLGSTARDRILHALVEIVAEQGYAGASVTRVIARAKVSRRSFDSLFASLEACFLAVLDRGLEYVSELVTNAFDAADTWQDGVRAALASLLVLFEREPLLARVWLVESHAAGAWALERWERNVAALRELIVSSRPSSESWNPPPLAAEGVMAAVIGVVHARTVAGRPEPLIDLLGPLMGQATAPYLAPLAVAREIERANELARRIKMKDSSPAAALLGSTAPAHPPSPGSHAAVFQSNAVLTSTLVNPNAHRARQCVCFLAKSPNASNHQIALAIGVAHKSQISRLLASLARQNIVVKRSQGAGHHNAWCLTQRGTAVAHGLLAATREVADPRPAPAAVNTSGNPPINS